MSDIVEKKTSFLSGLLNGKETKSTGIDFIDTEKSIALKAVHTLDFPTPRTEDWRQIPLRVITRNDYEPAEVASILDTDLTNYYFRESEKARIVLVNGRFNAELSDTTALPDAVYVGTFSDLSDDNLKRVSAEFNKVADYGDDPFVPFNTANFEDAVAVILPKDLQVETPIHIIHVTTGTQVFSTPRALIVAGRHSEATIVEDFIGVGSGAYFNTAITEAVLDDESHVTHVKLQRENLNSIHIGRTAARLGRGSNFNSYTISIGALLFRNEPIAFVDAENAHATLDGLVMISGEQISDTHSVLDHLKPNCTSHQLHKVIVHDSAKSVFNGKIFVRKDSQLIDAFQENRNLLLSPEATVFTKPQLEIFADDVKCSHGATIGQMSEEELFYLMSRGLSKVEATQLLTYGFALEVIENLPIESLREQLSEEVNRLTTKNIIQQGVA